MSRLPLRQTTTALITSTFTTPSTSTHRPKVTLPNQGTFYGSTLHPKSNSLPRSIEQFLGIPYATSPIRFAPPIPIPIRKHPYQTLSSGSHRNSDPIPEFDASRYGPRCPPGWGVDGIPHGEDCLNVNVFRPAAIGDAGDRLVRDGERGGDEKEEGEEKEKGRKEKKLLPVVVFFHGGAFNLGYGGMMDMSSFIAWSEADIVGVSFNYRTGVFGFLPLPVSVSGGLNGQFQSPKEKEDNREVGEEVTEKGGVFNIGLRDQLACLRWVKQNISHFGGDNSQITLMGVSAGAHSIGHLLLHDGITEEESLFHRVIMESGAPTARACYPPSHALHVKQMVDFLTILDIDPDLLSSKKGKEDVIETLRGIDIERLKNASDALFEKYNPSVRWPFQPVIDGEGGMIPRAPIQTWKERQWKQKISKIPILTGFNANEGSRFTSPAIATSQEFTNFFRTLLPGFTSEDLSQLNTVYPDPTTHPNSQYTETRPGLGAQFKRTECAYGQFAYIAPVRQTASLTSGITDVYLYKFAPSCSIDAGADHGAQSPFVYYSKEVRMFSEAVQKISGTMHAFWASFVATGDPNAVKGGRFGERVRWGRYVCGGGEEVGGRGREVMVFGEGNNEVAGGREEGVVARMKGDEWRESEFWWERSGKSES